MKQPTNLLNQPVEIGSQPSGVLTDRRAWRRGFVSELARLRLHFRKSLIDAGSRSAVLDEKSLQLAQVRVDSLLSVVAGPEGEFNEAEIDLDVSESDLLMRFLFRYGLYSKSDFLSLIEIDDILEVYDNSGIQLYRSWNLFQYSGYSLADLMTCDWDALYSRPPEVAARLKEMMPKVFQPEFSVTAYSIPEYVIEERLTTAKSRFAFKMKYCIPLRGRSGQTMAFLSTGRIRRLPPAT